MEPPLGKRPRLEDAQSLDPRRRFAAAVALERSAAVPLAPAAVAPAAEAAIATPEAPAETAATAPEPPVQSAAEQTAATTPSASPSLIWQAFSSLQVRLGRSPAYAATAARLHLLVWLLTASPRAMTRRLP